MSDAKPAEAAPPKKKGKLFLIIGIVVLVLVIGAAAVVFLMMKKSHSGDEGDGGEDVVATEKGSKSEKAGPPTFVKLDPFTVRLQSDGPESYLQAVPELRVLDAHVAEDVKTYMPEIRHKCLLVIAAKHPADVSTPDGVQKLADEMRVTINSIVAPSGGKKKKKAEVDGESVPAAAPDDPVQAVLFSSFIVQ